MTSGQVKTATVACCYPLVVKVGIATTYVVLSKFYRKIWASICANLPECNITNIGMKPKSNCVEPLKSFGPTVAGQGWKIGTATTYFVFSTF